MNIINKKGIKKANETQLPVWAKYTKSVRSGDERAFAIYSDGQIYNYASDSESDTTAWNDWGVMPSSYLDRILEIAADFENLWAETDEEKTLNDASVLIEYRKDGKNQRGIISKNYDSESGAILKKINDIVNEGLASRNKK